MLDLVLFGRHGGPDRVALGRWLAPFGPEVARQVLDGLDDSTAVIGPTSELVRLGQEPEAYLLRLGAALTRFAIDHPQVDRLFWLLNAEHPTAPPLVEVEAALGPWLYLEAADEVTEPRGVHRMLIRSALRDDRLAICFNMPRNGGDPVACLDAVIGSGLPIAALFLTRDQALSLQREGGPLAERLSAAMGRGRVALGLEVPAPDRDRALADLAEEARPVRELAGGADVGIVRFSPPVSLSGSMRLHAELRRAGFAADASFRAWADPDEIPISGDVISYFAAGAYQPQVFDLRSPTGRWRSGDPIAVVTLALGHRPAAPEARPARAAFGVRGADTGAIATFGDWDSLWAYRTVRRTIRLPPRLRHSLKEAFLEAMSASPALQQRYEEFMVYNWPPPEPRERVTLADGGPLDRPDRIAALLAETASFVAAGGRRRRLVGQGELLAAAQAEARARVGADVASSLALQRREHGYLGRIGSDSPLREDLQKFLSFLPAELGRALEIGSGYGQLARALSPRAALYICLELTEEMAAGLEPWIGSGIVADAHHLPFCDGSVDSVIANNSLEHLYDPIAALKETRRVLRPGGRLFAIVPLDRLTPRHVLRTHLWKADPASIESACAIAGLAVRRLEIVDLEVLGVAGSFPSCRGLVAMLDAEARD